MNIKAVVFDAYGTLYDVQSVAEVTEEAVSRLWRHHHANLAPQAARIYLAALVDAALRGFCRVTQDALAYTLRVLGLHYDDETFARMMENTCIWISIPMRWTR